MTDFSDKVSSLEKYIEDAQVEVDKSNGGISSMTIIAIATPIVAFFGLYLIKPKFVQSVNDEGEDVRSKGKIVGYTLGVTLLVWASLFAYIYFIQKKNPFKK